jgi:hypothetical protein
MSNRVGGALWWTLAKRAPLIARFLHQELHVSASAWDLGAHKFRHMSTLESGRRIIGGGALHSARVSCHP